MPGRERYRISPVAPKGAARGEGKGRGTGRQLVFCTLQQLDTNAAASGAAFPKATRKKIKCSDTQERKHVERKLLMKEWIKVFQLWEINILL